MSLRAVAWTILIAGVVALGTLVNEASLHWEIVLNSIPRYAPRTTQPGFTGLFDLQGENEAREPEAVRAMNARLAQERAAAERQRVDLLATLHTKARWNEGTFLLSVVVALVGLVYLAWATRRDIRAWHWFTVLSFAALATLAILVVVVFSGSPWRHTFLPLDGVSLAAAALDLRRCQYDSPGRLFTWAALITSILTAIVLTAMALGA